MKVKRIVRKSRLSQVIVLPGGKTLDAAVSAAETNVENLRDESMAMLDRQIAVLQAESARLRATAAPYDIAKLYATSDEILSLAGLFGLVELGDAAFSLCELLDQFDTRGEWNWNALDVHIGSLGLLRAAGAADQAPQRAAIVKGLQKISGVTR